MNIMLQQPITFRPLMWEFASFFKVTGRASKYDIPGIIRSSCTSERNNVVSVISCSTPLLVKLCFTVIALAMLPFVLLLNVPRSKGTVCIELPCSPIVSMLRMQAAYLPFMLSSRFYSLQALLCTYCSSALFTYPMQTIFFFTQSMKIFQCSRKNLTTFRASLVTIRSIAYENTRSMRSTVFIVLALFAIWMQFIESQGMGCKKLLSRWQLLRTFRTKFKPFTSYRSRHFGFFSIGFIVCVATWPTMAIKSILAALFSNKELSGFREEVFANLALLLRGVFEYSVLHSLGQLLAITPADVSASRWYNISPIIPQISLKSNFANILVES